MFMIIYKKVNLQQVKRYYGNGLCNLVLFVTELFDTTVNAVKSALVARCLLWSNSLEAGPSAPGCLLIEGRFVRKKH